MLDRTQRDLADRELGRALGREITRLRRHVRELEIASQGAFRSVEDGAIDVYDDDGVLRERIGKQTDGTYGRKSFTGEIPPAPTEPDVVVISDGVVAVSWDGRFEERYTGDFRNVQIHLGDTATFTPTRNTQEGAIFARRGGTVVCLTESDDDNPVWVRLVATNRAGEAGPASDAVLVDEDDPDGLDDEQEEVEWEDGDGHTLTAADITAGTVTFSLTYIPEERSLLAWWHPGGFGFAGVPQSPGVYTVDYETKSVTWPLSGFEQAGDRLRVYYAHLDAPAPLASVTAVNSGGGGFGEPFLVPVAAADGDTVIFAILVPDNETVSGNGYTFVTETAVVQHSAATYGPFGTQWRYKLQIWVGVKAAAVPTISGNAGGNPWVSVAYSAGSSVTGSAVATVGDGTTAPAPALTDGNLRIWANIGDHAYITVPESSTVLADLPVGDASLTVAMDLTPGSLVATSAPTSAGWMTATLSVTN